MHSRHRFVVVSFYFEPVRDSVLLFCSLHDFLPKEYIKVKGIEKKIFMVSFLHWSHYWGFMIKGEYYVVELVDLVQDHCWLNTKALHLFRLSHDSYII